ncbi:hypothetical protein [Chryseobacterium sp. AG844]|uniref:hypothetical protein n=1 Tax=Chryseobacterium sp. AG844 TaxID=2183998 RepID=UPI0011B25B75|nr:hypothetical protein [Chryseobacterium sp. AG844]
MIKNILKPFLILGLMTSIHSCIHDDVYSASNPSSNEYISKEYTSRSLWKEDEKYIQNVKKVFEKYADQNYFTNTEGQVAWNYTLTAGDEKFLEAPVIKNGKVNFILSVIKEDDRVYFKRDTDENSRRFFDILIFKDRNSLSGTLNQNTDNAQAKGCITIEKTVTWTDTQTGAVLQVDHFTSMHCTSSGPYLPCQAIDIDSPCGGTGGNGGGGTGSSGGGTGGGGYPYTQEIKDFTDNCAKVKNLTKNATFKSNVLNLESKTGLKGETGYIQRTDGSYTYQDGAGQSSTSNTLSLPRPDLPENKNIMAYLHTHVNDYTYTNADGVEETRTGIKMFSPADIAYFMDMLRNAQEAGRPLTDVYAVMITSSGNYQIRFTGNQYQLKNFTSDQIKKFTNDFPDFMAKYSGDLETGFLNFLSEKMNVKATNLYKMDSNGTNYEIKLTAEKTKMTSGCPG